MLEKIKTNQDLKALPVSALPQLCDEIRQTLLKKLSVKGGHVASNLGVIELTTAIHYVFNSPVDKIVFDVSHQSYIHKMLTGRAPAFLDPQHYHDVNGFSNPQESEHDLFTIGHTSTALSLACGLAKARDLLKQKHNVIAVIGDGSLSGGQAFEALNNIAEQNTNLIVVVNDNEMSIAENHGGYYQNLTDLRNSNGNAPHNLFKVLGLDYRYVPDGNNVNALVEVLTQVKNQTRPIVLHVHTVKGKGYAPAERNPEAFHFSPPFELTTGKALSQSNTANYFEITYQHLAKKMKADPSVVVISTATPKALGFSAERRMQAGTQYVDAGICEEHAVAFAAGIAKGGAKAVYGVYGSFLQRGFDQLHQDLALDNNPATLLVFGDTVYGMGGATHNGFYDIAELSNIPNLVYLAPTTRQEYEHMIDWSLSQTTKSVAIRVPAQVIDGAPDTTDYSQLNRAKVVTQGQDVAIIAVGSLFPLGEDVIKHLQAHGIQATLINPVYLSGIDTTLLDQLTSKHQMVITIEEGILEGGYGQKIAAYYGDRAMKVKNFGFEKSFFGDYDPVTLLKQSHLTVDAITDYILTNQ